MLTIAYITCRRNCQINWFFDSLHRETQGNYDGITIVVVDFHANEEGRKSELLNLAKTEFIHVPPKPTPWQGPFRLTQNNYYAVSNARNTAACYAQDGYIAYVDDVSVLIPGWLTRVKMAVKNGYIVLGSFRKVKKLKVENGVVAEFEDHPNGMDSRLETATRLEPDPSKLVHATGSWLYGSSLAIPIEALLKINGWDEDCDSMGMEDIICGIMIGRCGIPVFFDRLMVTYESEEIHDTEKSMDRLIKPFTNEIDSSHAILKWTMADRHTAPNWFNLRTLRKSILNGNPFPTEVHPTHDWRDGCALSTM